MEPLDDDGRHHWTEPGIYSVAPGVYRIPLPMPGDGLRAVNVYAITDGDQLTLVDSGWALDEARDRLAAALSGIGAGLGEVGRFLTTHVHRDHYTLAVALRREFGGRIALGLKEKAALDGTMRPVDHPMEDQIRLLERAGGTPVIEQLLARFGDAPPRPEENSWEEPDEWLTPGRCPVVPGREFNVIETPGHTAGHVVFADDTANLLFSGDHVLPHITPSIGFHPAPAELPLRDYLDSLRLVRSMPDRRLLPAHGPVSASVHSRVDELLHHHDRRLDEIGGMVAAGAGTAYAVALRLTWTRREQALTELDPFNQTLAVLETQSHLDLLDFQGRLRSTPRENVIHYALP